MGSSQSRHKFTVVNENDDINIIRISNGVAQRLSQVESDTSNELKLSESADEITTYLPTPKTMHQDDINYPYYTISAMDVYQERQKELDNQESYWTNRLNNLKKQHEAIDNKIKNEYNEAKKIFDDYKVKKIEGRGAICKIEEQNLHNCYCNNQQKVLNCAEIFAKYADCVSAHREKYMPF